MMDNSLNCQRITNSSITQLKRVESRCRKAEKSISFTEALREKYCSHDDHSDCDFIIDILYHGIPTDNGPTTAELGHLRNVDLSNRRVSVGCMPNGGFASLCPNVTDLDLSNNLFVSWTELLPLISQFSHLKYLNLSRNHITRQKEELWRWSQSLPMVENMVLNCTGIPLREVLALARLMPALRELHICCNFYRDLGSVELAINDGALHNLECLRLNENMLTSWSEIWKLRNLPSLTHLILSDNLLQDVFYCDSHQSTDLLFSLESPDITCHSDGEDSSFGSPHFRYPTPNLASAPLNDVSLFASTSSSTGKEDPSEHVTPSPRAIPDNNGSIFSEDDRNMMECSFHVQKMMCEETEDNSSSGNESEDEIQLIPFSRLSTLCLSRSSISSVEHLSALSLFPTLTSLRIMDIPLFNKVSKEDRRKLCIASLPNVQMLNGSEVTSIERDKAERHYLRYYGNQPHRPARYQDLEEKHGQLDPLYDIHLGAKFSKYVTLAFMLNGRRQFTESVSVLQPVGKLRAFVARRLAIPRMSFRLFHSPCAPHKSPDDGKLDELFLDSLPLSRFDLMEGDQLHIELCTETSYCPVVQFSKRDIMF